jgi:hypothetical protein
MANELKWTYAASVGLETSGASVAAAAFSQAAIANLSSSNHSNYPFCDFVLKTVGFSAAVGTGKTVNLYRQDLDIGGVAVNDAPNPSASNKNLPVGSFVIPDGQASTGTVYFTLTDVPLNQTQSFWIEDNLGVNMTAGWALTAVPKSYVPG